VQRSDQINELAAALAKAQGSICNAAKDQVGQSGNKKYKYATLGSVFDACREALSRNNLAVTQDAEVTGAGVKISTMLMHSSGQFLSNEITLPISERSEKGIGMAITYGRRYALSAMVGVAPEDDDGPGGRPLGSGPNATPFQVKELLQAVADIEMLHRDFTNEILERYKVSEPQLLTYQQADEHLKLLRERLEAKKKISAGNGAASSGQASAPAATFSVPAENVTLQEGLAGAAASVVPTAGSVASNGRPTRDQLTRLISAREAFFDTMAMLHGEITREKRDEAYARRLGMLGVKSAKDLAPAAVEDLIKTYEARVEANRLLYADRQAEARRKEAAAAGTEPAAP
jgi:hypothetical protein